MTAIYVTRRAFKSNGKLYEVGQIITAPSLIKRFNNKLAERKIIVLRKDDDFESTVEYLESRSGLELRDKYLNLLDAVSGSTAAKEQETAEQETEESTEPVATPAVTPTTVMPKTQV